MSATTSELAGWQSEAEKSSGRTLVPLLIPGSLLQLAHGAAVRADDVYLSFCVARPHPQYVAIPKSPTTVGPFTPERLRQVLGGQKVRALRGLPDPFVTEFGSELVIIAEPFGHHSVRRFLFATMVFGISGLAFVATDMITVGEYVLAILGLSAAVLVLGEAFRSGTRLDLLIFGRANIIQPASAARAATAAPPAPEAAPPAPKPEARTTVLAPADLFDTSAYMRIPGRPEHQRDREKLFHESTKGGAEAFVGVELVCDPDGGVSVQCLGATLGHFSRTEAAEFRERMRAMGKGENAVGFCVAMIANDGFNPGERFVLLLNLKWPIEEQATAPTDR